MVWLAGRPVWPSRLTIRVEYECHDGVILKSIQQWTFATKFRTMDTSNQTDAMSFCVVAPQSPPLHIRNYIVIVRSSDAIYGMWLVENTITIVRLEWPSFRSLLFRIATKFAYSCNNSFSNTTSAQMFNNCIIYLKFPEDKALLRFLVSNPINWQKYRFAACCYFAFESHDGPVYFEHDEYVKFWSEVRSQDLKDE